MDGDRWYADEDGDGFGDGDSWIDACTQPPDHVDNGEDLDDSDPSDMFGLAGDWTTLGNDPGHRGYFEGSVGSMLLEHAWTVTFEEYVNQVAVVEGTVFASTDGYFDLNSIWALDAADGAELWSYEFEEAFSVNAPTWYEGTVLLQRGNHSSDTDLWCFDADDGTLLWRSEHSAQWETYYAPTAADGMVWVNGGTYGGMYGFDAGDGEQLFYVGLPQYDEWTPAYEDGVVYSWVEGELNAHDPVTGESAWELDLGWDWSGWAMSTAPVVADGVAYVAGTALHAVDVTEGVELWSASGSFEGIPAVAHGVVYAIVDGAVEAFDAEDGTYLGIYLGDGDLYWQPIVTDDVLIAASGSETFVMDLDTFEILDSVPYGGHLSVSDDQLFIASADGDLVAYDWVSAD